MITLGSCRNARRLHILIVLVTMSLVVGCSSIKSGGERISATGIDPGDKIAIVPNVMADTDDSFENSLAACIQGEIKNLNADTRFMSYHDFRTTIFGDSKQADLPLCNEIIKVASDDFSIKSRLESLEIRYLVCVSGGSYSGPIQSSGFSSYGGGAVVLYWKKNSTADVRVYDLRKSLCAGSLAISVEDTGVVGILPPLFIPAVTESRACKQLGKDVAHFLVSKEKPITVPQGANEAQGQEKHE